MNDNIDSTCRIGAIDYKAEDEYFWRFMETSFINVTKSEQLWIECIDKLANTCMKVVEFAKNIYITSLTDHDDVYVLLDTIELAVIRMSRYIEPSTKCVLFDYAILPERAFYTTEMEEIDLVSSIFNCAKDIADLKLSVSELSIFSAVVLYNDERPGLIYRNEVKSRKKFMMRALKAKLDHSGRQPLENGVSIYDALIAKIRELRIISSMYVNAFRKFELSHPHVRFETTMRLLHQELLFGYSLRTTAA